MWPITITEPGIDAEVLGVQHELLPEALDVGEVVAQAVVAAVGPGAAGEPRGAREMQLAVRRSAARARASTSRRANAS